MTSVVPSRVLVTNFRSCASGLSPLPPSPEVGFLPPPRIGEGFPGDFRQLRRRACRKRLSALRLTKEQFRNEVRSVPAAAPSSIVITVPVSTDLT